jgi:STE24 endopeptidase
MDTALPKSPINLRRRIEADPHRYFSAEEIERSKGYTRPLQRASLLSNLIGTATMIAIIATRLPQRMIDWTGVDGWFLQLLVVLAGMTVLLTLCDLPVAVWKTFTHEEKWGFNKQTPKGFVLDLIKNALIFGILIQALLFAPVWALIRATSLWWLYGGIAIMAISLVLGFVYPVLILPVFNKFTPLEDGDLLARLRALAERAKVSISEFKVMNASKRSTKDNAFFVGMGATRRVVIYDNMLTLPHTNTEVVIAHEIGHWRRGHIRRNIITGVVRLPVLLGLTAIVVSQGWFLRLAGVDRLGSPAALPSFLVVIGAVFMVLNILDAAESRWFEREADFDALELTHDPQAFAEVWRNMIDRNLPDLTPNWWARLKASHPPICERLAYGEAWAAANPDAKRLTLEPAPSGAQEEEADRHDDVGAK